MIFCKKKKEDFKRENLKKSIERAKKMRASIDDLTTDTDSNICFKTECEETSEMLTIAIKAMQLVLYDL